MGSAASTATQQPPQVGGGYRVTTHRLGVDVALTLRGLPDGEQHRGYRLGETDWTPRRDMRPQRRPEAGRVRTIGFGSVRASRDAADSARARRVLIGGGAWGSVERPIR